MKQLLIIALSLTAATLTAQAQQSKPVETKYIIFTSTKDDIAYRGVERGEVTDYNHSIPGLDKSPIIIFDLFRKNVAAYELTFMHCDFDSLVRAQTCPVDPLEDMQEIIMKHRCFLDSVELIDWDHLGNIYSNTQAWEFGESMRGKKVYFIDRNDMTADSVKLIQVSFQGSNKPTNDVIIVGESSGGGGIPSTTHMCQVCGALYDFFSGVSENYQCDYCAAGIDYLESLSRNRTAPPPASPQEPSQTSTPPLAQNRQLPWEMLRPDEED